MTLIRRKDGAIRAGWRCAAYLATLAIAAALLASLFYLTHFPKQRSAGQLQPLPLLATAAAVIDLVAGISAFYLRSI